MPRKTVTLTHFIIEEQRRHHGASGSFTSLVNDLSTACKIIAHEVNRGNLVGGLSAPGTENIQGESQKALDVIANDSLLQITEIGGYLTAMASEEMEDIYMVPPEYPRGRYLLLFDPLDGSSNIDVNLSVGTIFSVLRCPEGVDRPTAEDFLQPGTQQVCAGYTLYGPSAIMVLTTGQSVNGFTLDRNIGSFVLSHPDMRIPETTREFAINAARAYSAEPPVKRYVEECIAGAEGPRGEAFSMRWTGSMVADVHRILTRGGVFIYGRDTREAPEGRLRLMYEANPMSFIIEQAGGLSSTGRERIMELQPTDLHQRVPVVLGSKHEVERIVSYHAEAETA